MRLSTDGEAFLPHARTLLAAQELALMTPPEPERELTIAISDHVAGPELPEILARVHACDPALMLKVRVNYSRNVIAQFDDGLADVAVVRRQGKRRDGELLFEDQYGWFASVGARLDGKLLPLITVTDECGVGETATRLLAAAKTPGLTHFLAAASPPRSPRPVRASACYPAGGWRRPGLVDVGGALALPPLPGAQIMMHARRFDAQTTATLRVLAAAFRSAAARP